MSKRDTRQRRAILSALTQADRPLGPREILDLAQLLVPRLGIATVAKAVESETICSFLAENGVNYGQGYLFGRPRPAELIEKERAGV